MKIEIIAVSRAKKGAHKDLIDEYVKRTRWNVTLHEIESKQTSPEKAQKDEEQKILPLMNSSAFIVVMDERGKNFGSLALAQKIEDLQNIGHNHFQFIIGGADGVTDAIRDKANLLLSFGKLTWPHMLARVMLLEQIYRVQQILAGHPYHRE